ncbi:hypothetical protein SCWH03_34260 [Streptomyces pacificus]|uniref:Uncharacterized protein n=1 Tax=Streptomyces pacificus TaxID=2705029 RepID=A0A6A0AW71_9ACTN|nr:hypothetical protein SCWH03_34260 [Streptomyces pacificus]
MTPLFERLDQEEALVRGELATLREKVTVTEERLAHLTITRETLLSLGGEDCGNQDDATQQAPERPAAEPMPRGLASDPQPAGEEVPADGPASAGPLEWEVAREQMLVLLAGAGRAMKVQDIASAIGDPRQRPHRITLCVVLDQLQQGRHQARVLVRQGRAACSRPSHPPARLRVGVEFGQAPADTALRDPCGSRHRGDPTVPQLAGLRAIEDSALPLVQIRRHRLKLRP